MKEDQNYISISYLFQAFAYFKNHFIIKDLFTPSICEWVFSYKNIEVNPLLLFSIQHILKLINKHYSISYHVNYEIQNITMIKNKAVTLYSPFLQKYDFKLIIPLSKCNIRLNDDFEICLNSGEIMVLTSERTFEIINNVDIISIDVSGSFDAIYIKDDEGIGKHLWWLIHLPTSNSECLKYITNDI